MNTTKGYIITGRRSNLETVYYVRRETGHTLIPNAVSMATFIATRKEAKAIAAQLALDWKGVTFRVETIKPWMLEQIIHESAII